jgi:hypothetical protein
MINYTKNAKTFSLILEPEMRFPFSICPRFPETTKEEEKFETNGILIASELGTKTNSFSPNAFTIQLSDQSSFNLSLKSSMNVLVFQVPHHITVRQVHFWPKSNR